MPRSRVLVVYFSRTGNTRRVAEDLANALACDIDQISEAEDRGGFRGYWRSVGEARRRLPAATAAGRLDPSRYDIVIIGTPVWAWSVSSPVRAYLTVNAARLKDVAFFATMGGAGARSAFAQMQDLAGKPPHAVCAVTDRELGSPGYRRKLGTFLDQLMGPSGSPFEIAA